MSNHHNNVFYFSLFHFQNQMTKLLRHDSSSAERVRSGNFPIVVNREGTFEIHWAKKFSDSSVDLYSSDDSRVEHKTPWGSVIDVGFETLLSKKKEVIADYLVAKNARSERCAFKICELRVSFNHAICFLSTENHFSNMKSSLIYVTSYLSTLSKVTLHVRNHSSCLSF